MWQEHKHNQGNELELLLHTDKRHHVEPDDDSDDDNYDCEAKMMDYAFSMYEDKITNAEKSELALLFQTESPQQLRENFVEYCIKSGKSHTLCKEFRETAQQCTHFKELQERTQLRIRNDQQETPSCCNRWFYSIPKLTKLKIIGRDIFPKRMVLKCQSLNESRDDPDSIADVVKIEITKDPYNVFCDELMNSKGDMLSHINDASVYGWRIDDVYEVLKCHPLSTLGDDRFTITFEGKYIKCMKCASCCLKSKKRNKSKKLRKGIGMLLGLWAIKFMKLSLGIISKTSSILDMVTDIILLYGSIKSNAIFFTALFIISLLSPYILSYSAGVQIFLYRKTFQNLEIVSFKALLLAFYLFPTGIIYFIFLDIMDALVEVYKWIAFGCIHKIKSQQELVQIESHVAEYFGMSRMDWFSFGKQKLITQVFFETAPQCILQSLLFWDVIKGREILTDVSDEDLIRSIVFALLNICTQCTRLFAESKAVQETFVEYSLNCMTARFEWVPFKHQIERAQDGESPSINYSISYPLPVITRFTKWLQTKHNYEPLRIYTKFKPIDVIYGSVEYDFSSKTITTLISEIKQLPNKESIKETKTATIAIKFGSSLRLLDIRSIVSLMQACYNKGIHLPDIQHIDWDLAFQNTPKDPRLFTHTFDEYDKSLLISVYLTQFHADNYSILREFVLKHDVQIHLQDGNGDTIMHHMIRNEDYDAIYVLLDCLKPKQRFNFNTKNDKGHSIIRELIDRKSYNELLYLLNVAGSKCHIEIEEEDIIAMMHHRHYKELIHLLNGIESISYNINIPINCADDDGNTIIHHLCHRGKYHELEQFLAQLLETNKHMFQPIFFNHDGESAMFLALENDVKRLHKYNESQNRKLNNVNNQSKQSKLDVLSQNLVKKAITLITDDADYIQKLNINAETMANIMQCNCTLYPKQAQKYTRLLDNIYMFRDTVNQQMSKDVAIDDDIKQQHEIQYMHRILINHFPELITACIQRTNSNEEKEKEVRTISILGYMLLVKCYKAAGSFFHDIIHHLLQKNALLFPQEQQLLYPLFQEVIRASVTTHIAKSHLNTLQEIITRFKLSLDIICDENGNNPIHFAVLLGEASISKLSLLCNAFPQWMITENKAEQIPLLLAISIKGKNINTFYCLVRCMLDEKIDIKIYFQQKIFVQRMIEFGYHLLKADAILYIQMLLSTFKYPEIFRWCLTPHDFNNAHDAEDISLIKFVSTTNYASKIDTTLFGKCLLDNQYAKERAICLLDNKYAKERAIQPDYEREEAKVDYIEKYKEVKVKHETEAEHDEDTKYDEEEFKGDIKLNEDINDHDIDDIKLNDELKHDPEPSKHAVHWIESIYSTIVEIFSALDLLSDLVILYQLFIHDHQWWTTCMALLLVAPYLVSLGSLIEIIKKKSDFSARNKSCKCCSSAFMVLLMTPLSIFYLFFIDILFMMFSVISTVWLMISSLFICLFLCTSGSDLRDVSQYDYDIREWVDDKIFRDVFDMNRTDIVGYRRLRSLSQLFFETMPQIVLQIRILYVADNSFHIDLETLYFSIILAICHLILEGGIIFLDKSAFKLSFLEYSLECLGGRVQWIPFQHLIHNIVTNQLYIVRDGDSKHLDKYKKFDAESYPIAVHNVYGKGKNHKMNPIILDYEDINADIHCFKYVALYQFSEESLDALIEELVTCPTMKIPLEFKLFSANAPIHNLMKHLLCTAQLILGPKSITDKIDPTFLYTLHQSSVCKIKLKIQHIDSKMIETVLKRETSAITEAMNVHNIPLHTLQECFHENIRIGLECDAIQTISSLLKKCFDQCEEDESWYFVAMFLLLYTRGSIYGIRCSAGCCTLDEEVMIQRDTLLKHWVPANIEISGLKIPFHIFQSCGILHKYLAEEILVNKCKNYIITHNKDDVKQNEIISNNDVTLTIAKELLACKQWSYFKDMNNVNIIAEVGALMSELQLQIQHTNDTKNIALLDELVCRFQININEINYIGKTLSNRDVVSRSFVKSKSKTHTLTLNDLEFNLKKRYQIYEIQFKFDVYSFEVFLKINKKTEDKIIAEDVEEILINANNHNNFLSTFNHFLLRCSDIKPHVIIEASDICDVKIDLKYVELYTEDDQKQLDEKRQKHEQLQAQLQNNKSSMKIWDQPIIKKLYDDFDFHIYDTKEVECDEYNHDPLDGCNVVKRMIMSLICYSQLDVHYSKDDADIFIKFIKEVHPFMVRDRTHVVNTHKSDLHAISEAVAEKKILPVCDVTKCPFVARYHSRQSNKNESKLYSDGIVRFYCRIMDSFHIMFMHPQTLHIKRESKFNMPIAAAAAIETAFLEELFKYLLSKNIRETPLKKLAAFINLQEYDTDAIKRDLQHGIKCNTALNIQHDEIVKVITKFSKQLKIWTSSFQLGFTFYYWSAYKNLDQFDQNTNKFNINDHAGYKISDLFVQQRYSSFKEEIHDYKHMNMREYQKTLTKVTQYMYDDDVKKRKAYNKKDDGNIVLLYGIKHGEALRFVHLLALFFYTDFTKFCVHFSSTFRAIKPFESLSSVKARNSKYYFMSKNLREIVELFGESKSRGNLNGPFYAGVSLIMPFTGFEVRLCGPVSASKKMDVVMDFAGSQGMVVQLNNNVGSGHEHLSGFDTTSFADFADGAEIIFMGGHYRIKVESVQLLEGDINCAPYFDALSKFSKIFNASYADKDEVTEEDKEIISNLVNWVLGKHALLDKINGYVADTFLSFAHHKQHIVFNYDDLYQHNDKELLDIIFYGMKCDKTFKPEKESKVNIFLPQLFAIFVNLKKIDIYSDEGEISVHELLNEVSENWKSEECQITIKAENVDNISWISYLWSLASKELKETCRKRGFQILFKNEKNEDEDTLDCLQIKKI